MLCLVVQSCPTPLCDPMDYSLPGPSVHGILQARILEWVAMASSRGSSQHRDQTQVSCITIIRVFLLAQLVKNLPAMQETVVQFLGREDLLEKG